MNTLSCLASASACRVGFIDANNTPDPVTPLRHDVLLGRGRASQSHLGNVCFREFLKQYCEEYDLVPRKQRREVVCKIRQDLQKRGIRFLQEQNEDEWVECSAAEAEKTIAKAFRKSTQREEVNNLGRYRSILETFGSELLAQNSISF